MWFFVMGSVGKDCTWRPDIPPVPAAAVKTCAHVVGDAGLVGWRRGVDGCKSQH